METAERRIKVPTTGVFDFPTLIEGGKGMYIDKTALLYEMCSDADQQLFISRPRHFGKSLMLSTLKAMFEGRRELFKGLALDSLPWEGWTQPTPVYSFTMSKAVGETYELFMEQLAKLVKGLCQMAGVEYSGDGAVSGQFDDFLAAAAAKSPTKKCQARLQRGMSRLCCETACPTGAKNSHARRTTSSRRASRRSSRRTSRPLSRRFRTNGRSTARGRRSGTSSSS
ncbi:MAG: AAA family ATPase [Kiritimatiellae bacterium]|nr:AAA family ATPase [Kiritimatiellia bacterium]